MKVITGDLIKLVADGYFDVIIHGCNCQCTMAAGIAKTIKNIFPEAYYADCATTKGDRSKLGTISYATVELLSHTLTVVNAYIQYDWRGPQIRTDYNAVRSAIHEVKHQFSGMRIGYPLFGIGLTKGDWEVIEIILSEELEGEDHTLVVNTNK
ncbi:macro domain-containing protein [Endozoicomonas sp. SM1973]|uniref:Macro domain-containing protein n=1 Tax=Spartinivicinus marinus TaxID=2994442 RepID=A0A853I0E3_9GAMM|nr:macro domain-containing protein [Spartinivicinus marinus]MCX4026521.1 macro domain-containing protein [Spartinivicinus marinus]NYZ66893.1 macro domain-containing protein [Spartinivicinus marinus]